MLGSLVLLTAIMMESQTAPTMASPVRTILERYDVSHDGQLDRLELARYFDHEDSEVRALKLGGAAPADVKKVIDDRVEDALSFRGNSNVISIDDLAAYVTRAEQARTPRVLRIGWKGLGFRRFLSDPVDPREPDPDPKPTVFSYLYDHEADVRHQFSALGGIQLYKFVRDYGEDFERTLIVKPGIQAKIDGAKKTEQTTDNF